jgi:hypothetical protein
MTGSASFEVCVDLVVRATVFESSLGMLVRTHTQNY